MKCVMCKTDFKVSDHAEIAEGYFCFAGPEWQSEKQYQDGLREIANHRAKNPRRRE